MYARGMTTNTLDAKIAAIRAADLASYSQREAALVLGISMVAMRARVWQGSIPAVHIGSAIRIPRSVVQSLLTNANLLTRATELTTAGGGDAA